MPLTGYVWEEGGEIIGNASLVPFRYKGKRIFLIANIAVHPNFRRRGIARDLTERAMQHARLRNADSIWLHVRDDNPGAVKLYEQLGFTERTCRTTWQSTPDIVTKEQTQDFIITKRPARFWPQQHAWLERIFSDEIAWYRQPNWWAFSPGLLPQLYSLLVDYNVHQWAIFREEQLLATVSWQPTNGKADPLWVAFPPKGDEHALASLLTYAHRKLQIHRTLTIDYPADEADSAIRSAGFIPLRTLIWMRAPGATC